MSKTITLRVDDETYTMFKKAARGDHRTISNFIKYATVSYLTYSSYVSDEEMDEIINDKSLMKSLTQGEKDIKAGKYKIVR